MSIFDTKKHVNNANRSTFDMSQHNLFTARLGQLTPVMFRNLMPGDNVSLDLSSFTQTSPLQKNAYARIKEHFDVFFVPYRLLYNKANDILVENKSMTTANSPLKVDNVLRTSLPHTTFSTFKECLKNMIGDKDVCGQDRAFGSRRLLHYLGYGDVGQSIKDEKFGNLLNEKLSLMPLATYQKIYSDFFRFQQWEDADPYSYNFDYLSSSNLGNVNNFLDAFDLLGVKAEGHQSLYRSTYGGGLLDIRYVNYNKDFLFGVLPSQIADVYVSQDISIYGDALFNLERRQTSGDTSPVTVNSIESVSPLGTSSSTTSQGKLTEFKANISSKLSVLNLRAAYALQKWSEIQQFSDNNYKALVKAHFGVDVPDYTAQLSEYIGGTSSIIQINDVVNTNLADGDADRQATANGVTNAYVNYTAKEHGTLMVLYYASPMLDYDSSHVYDPQLLAVDADDFPKSEFDNLGLEPVYNDVLFSQEKLRVIGYAPRYWSWKSVIDYYKGAFCYSLSGYIMKKNLKPFSDHSDPKFALSYRWFKVNPTDVDSIFVVQADKSSDYDGDHFYVNSGQNCKITRSLSYSGMPY